MTDESNTEVVTIMCPCCSSLFEIPDVRGLLLALHLARYCNETEGIAHA